jgi:hypothetical protein
VKLGDRERLIEVLGIGSEIIQRKEWYSVARWQPSVGSDKRK